MEEKKEQVFVGLFVIVATALLIFTVFALSGAFAGAAKTYHAKFPNVGGLSPGASIHYGGLGQKVGRVEKMQIDTSDPRLIDMTFSVKKDVPIKTDSLVSIQSTSPLGDNHVEIKPGSPTAPLAPAGAQLPAKPYVGFNDLSEQISNLSPKAQELMDNLNQRVKELGTTIARINELLNDKNRANISGSLETLNGMLKEDRPLVSSTLKNVNSASERFGPLLEQLKKATDQANATLKNVDGVIGENREDLRASVVKLHQSLNTVEELTRRLNQTLDVNSENIDVILDNFRHASENLREFTDEIKSRPSSLVNSSSPREHKPGEHP